MRQHSTRYFCWSIVLAGIVAMAYGCQQSGSASTKASASAGKGGAELWSENCMRCHNLRPPTEFSNSEWQVIVHHMRVRADLTGDESDRILAFIKSANSGQ